MASHGPSREPDTVFHLHRCMGSRLHKRCRAEAEADLDHAGSLIGDVDTWDDFQDRADCGVRFRMFLLATHYWEGRWLLDMQDGRTEIVKSHGQTRQVAVTQRWHRRMMLTPCAVSTFASLPKKLSYASRGLVKEYLYNFIDLLIVDEAGQVLPEVGGASFGLAKRALVIGDTQQIEPISSIPQNVDIGNLKSHELLARDEDWDDLSHRGLCSANGSIMRLAQHSCRVSPKKHEADGLEKGLYLFAHRRCYDEIIEYCNQLCYQGKM